MLCARGLRSLRSGRSQRPSASALAPIQAARALRRTDDLRATRLAGLRRALPERLVALLLFIERRRGEAFFFAILAMVVLSFSFP